MTITGKSIRGVLTALAAVSICIWLVYPDNGHAQQRGKSPASQAGSHKKRVPLTQQGSVEKVYLESRRVIISGVMYYLSDKLVVKDKKGEVLPDYRIKYLSWAHKIEFTSSDFMISEIVILEYAS